MPATLANAVPTFASIAQLIAGPNAPPWLTAHFERFSPSLKVDRDVEHKQPTKLAMKKRLVEVRDAALLLRHALNDAAIREFLEVTP